MSYLDKPDPPKVLARIQHYVEVLEWIRSVPDQWIKAEHPVRTSPMSLYEDLAKRYADPENYVIRYFMDEDRVDELYPQFYFKYNGPATSPRPDTVDPNLEISAVKPLKPIRRSHERLPLVSETVAAARFYIGAWLKVENVNPAVGNHIRSGKSYTALPDEFVTTHRTRPGEDKNHVDLYIMYTGGEQFGVPDLDASQLIFKSPPPARSSIAGDAAGFNTAAESKPATWLKKVVTPAGGNWVEYPGQYNHKIPNRIRRGDMYGAHRAQYDIDTELHQDGSHTMRGRVNPEWLKAEEAGTLDQLKADILTMPVEWRGTMQSWVDKRENDLRMKRIMIPDVHIDSQEPEVLVQETTEPETPKIIELEPEEPKFHLPVKDLAEIDPRMIRSINKHPSLLPAPSTDYIRQDGISITEWLDAVVDSAGDWVDYPGPALSDSILNEIRDGFGNSDGYLFDVFNGLNEKNVEFTRAKLVLPDEDD